MSDDKVTVENVNTPGRTQRVDAAKYNAMRDAYLKILPVGKPGMTASDAKDVLKPHLPQDQFPGGKTSGWWMKAVQLDLEAKGIVAREETKPLKFHKI